jgi:ribonucleoside-triphosphate reductase
MCCRLNMDLTQLMNRPGGMWSMGDSTGSIGVVTLNLNRYAYKSKNKEEFFARIAKYMELAKQSLEIKRKVIDQNLQNGLMPYTKRYLGTFNNHFSTIGLCGMNEACMNLLGKDKDISSPEGKQLAIDTLTFMRERTREFQQETSNLYNLEATPAESTAYRFAKMDVEICPDVITAGEDKPFLTNSSQLPVNFTDDPIKAMEHQNDIQPLYTGGTIFHTFMGEKMTDWKAARNLVKRIAENTKLPYFSLTPTFSVCQDHGYQIGEHFTCKETNEKGEICGKSCEVFSRIVGYYRPVQNWNDGKREEYKHRVEFLENKGNDGRFTKEVAPAVAAPAPTCAA